MTLRSRHRSRARNLITERRRNRVLRFGALYAAGAFIVLQVADVAFEPLGIPGTFTRLLVVAAIIGFPIIILLAWAVDETPEATRWTDPRAADPEPAEPPSPNRMVVIPFAVRGGDEYGYLAEGMVDLLSAKLCCAGELRYVDPHALLSFMKQRRGKRVDPADGGQIAQHFGAGLFVLGNVLEASGQIHIDATIYRCVGEVEVVTRCDVEGPASEMFGLVDDLAREILTGLTAESGTRLAKLAVTTTDSLEALTAYLQGESDMRAMRRLPAVEAFQRAVAADPTFSLAWYRLGMAGLWSGQLELARDAAERAQTTAERLTEHDQLLVQAFRAFLRGESEEAERLYRTIVGVQPDDVEAWYQLAEVLFHYRPRFGGSVIESRPAWERVLSLEPEHVSALVHMALIAACEGNEEEVASLVDRALAISPEGDAVTWMLALRAWLLGDRASQKRVAAKLRRGSDFSAARSAWYVALPSRELDGAWALTELLTDPSRSPESRTLGHVWLAHLELVKGRWGAALDQLAAVERIDPASATLYRALLHLYPCADVPAAELGELAAAVANLDCDAVPPSITTGAYFTVHNNVHPQLKLYLLGVMAAKRGDDSAASSYAAQLENLEGRPEAVELARDQAIGIRARVKMNEGNDAEALELLETASMSALFELTMASPFFSQALERYLRAELLDRLGRTEEALRWYGSFREHSTYDLIYLAPSHLRRAQIFERSGDHQKATLHYSKFLALWKDCDVELAGAVKAAEQRLAGVSGQLAG